jgi:FkbH-like protein
MLNQISNSSTCAIKEVLSSVKVDLKNNDREGALEKLKAHASPTVDYLTQSTCEKLGKAIAADPPGYFDKIKTAFLGGCTLDHWVDSISFWLLLQDFSLTSKVFPIGAWRQQILEPSSELYVFKPDIVWLYLRPDDFSLQQDTSPVGREGFDLADNALEDLLGKVAVLQSRLDAFVVINNLVAPSARVLGNYEGAKPDSFAMTINAFNMGLAKRLPVGVAIFDIAHIAAQVGLHNWEDARLWHHSKHPFSLRVNAEVGFAASRLISALKGRSKKCIVVDLDNTLWGGVVGDDGVNGIKVGPDGGVVGEAYSAFQVWLKAMSRRGIALAVCSKNDIDIAKEPFSKKSGMALSLDDFVAFKADWNNKADNLRAIADELNIGLDSIVFVDDNPVERDLIRKKLPQVAVPEMPTDPSDFITAIATGRWFETVTQSKEDLLRVEAYRQNAARREEEGLAADLDTFLSGLDMAATWGAVDSSSLQRVAQLINKTNQFQLTLSRYTEAEVNAKSLSPAYWVGHFSLADRFGDHGIISAVILRFESNQCFIETWVMSCRVFSRTMEQFIFNVILDICAEKDVTELFGTYKASAKNKIVADLYINFGGHEQQALRDDEKCYVFYPTLKPCLQKTFVRDKSRTETISVSL